MAWNVSSEARYFGKFLSDEITMTDTTPINSDAIPAGAAHDETNAAGMIIGGQHLYLGIQVTTGGTDLVADLLLQHSPDGTNWTTDGTVIADTTPNVTGWKLAYYDLSTKHAPYWRLRFNDAAVAVGATGKFKFMVCALNPVAYSQWPL